MNTRRELDDVHAIDRAHAKLSASGAHRWMACQVSVWMEAHFPDIGSEFSEEGTRAHLMASECLLHNLHAHEWVRAMDDESAELIGELYPVEMQDHVQDYLNFVRERLDQITHTIDALFGIEQRVNFSRFVPEGFGTADFWCYLPDENLVEVIDLKYGKGVAVAVEENEQAMLYALGVWEALQAKGIQPKEFKVTIFQPRIGNVASWMIDTKSLLRWADRVLVPIAAKVWRSLVENDISEVEFKTDDPELCRFCKAKTHCRARTEARLEMAQYSKEVAIMTDKEVEAVLPEVEHLVKWGNDLKAWAQERVAKGRKIKGWKLVEGRSNRKITDVPRAVRLLRFEGYSEDQIYEPRKILGITKLETLVHGKKALNDIIGGVIDKPQGRPVLVPESDPREEFKVDSSHVAKEFEAV